MNLLTPAAKLSHDITREKLGVAAGHINIQVAFSEEAAEDTLKSID